MTESKEGAAEYEIPENVTQSTGYFLFPYA
jgi:hypothetical protein